MTEATFNQITARGRNRTLVTGVKDTCTTAVPPAPHPHIEESRAASENIQVFKIADLTDMYTSCMPQRAATVTSCIHTSRVKEPVLARIADLGARRRQTNRGVKFY